ANIAMILVFIFLSDFGLFKPNMTLVMPGFVWIDLPSLGSYLAPVWRDLQERNCHSLDPSLQPAKLPLCIRFASRLTALPVGIALPARRTGACRRVKLPKHQSAAGCPCGFFVPAGRRPSTYDHRS